MEKRFYVAIFLSILVLYAYQALVPKPPQPATAGTNATTVAGPSGSSAAPGAANLSNPGNLANPENPSKPANLQNPQSSADLANSVPVISDPSERDLRVETRDVIAVFTNRGARLKSWRLKRYFDQQREPQELIREYPGHPLPFTLKTSNAAATAVLNNALFAVTGAPAAPLDTESADLRFEYKDVAGLAVVKTFHIDPVSYILTFHASVTQDGKPVTAEIHWGPAMGDSSEVSRYSQAAEGLLWQTDKVQRLSAKDIAKQSAYEGDFRYAGVDDNYFMSTALAATNVKLSYQPVTIPPADPKGTPHELVAYSIEPRQDAPLKFFIGPKDLDVLAALGPDLTRAINFGIFAPIVAPLLRSLKWVNGYVGNYGWSIVILTIIINLILFPLQHKSIVSMRRMQEIQPQMKAIQDRYAKYKSTDPEKQKMNSELMALYKDKGVNPAGGCVPMLLTIPVLYAMWAMLSTAIELRGAPFVGWIHDLTQSDPYYVAPLLMGATMFWQTKMTPAVGGDPAQQRMQMMMPVVMTAMFIWMPSGALLYYVVSNLWRIGQQYLTNAIIGPPNVRTPRPPAERKSKTKTQGSK